MRAQSSESENRENEGLAVREERTAVGFGSRSDVSEKGE